MNSVTWLQREANASGNADRRRPGRLVSLAIFLLAGGCEAEAAWVCRLSAPDGPSVRVASEEVAEAERWGAVELWTADALDEGGAELMMPTSARVRSDGVLSIADFGSGEVWLLDREGEWMAPVAGRGQGPGELLNPLATAWTPEGELLALDAAQSKLERYDVASGTSKTLRLPSELLAPVSASGEVGWFGMRGDGMVFVEWPSSTSGADTIRYARAAPGDAGASVIREVEHADGLLPAYDRPSRPEWPRARLAVGTDRWLVAPRSDRYELFVYGADDEPELHVCVSDRESFRQSGADGGPPDADRAQQVAGLPPPEREALFSRVHLDHDGRIWIERELPMVGSSFDLMYGVAGAHLDVLSPEGAFLARMKLPGELRFQDARGDTIWAFRIGELEEVDVVAARITRTAR